MNELINKNKAITALIFSEETKDIKCEDMKKVLNVLNKMPSAESERLTDDDFETIRIHLNALKERLCNQRRWKEAEDYERLINRFIFFASAKPEIIHCKNCKHRESNDCPMYYEEWIEIDEGDGYFDTDNIIHDWTTDEGFCHCAELRGKEE